MALLGGKQGDTYEIVIFTMYWNELFIGIKFVSQTQSIQVYLSQNKIKIFYCPFMLHAKEIAR